MALKPPPTPPTRDDLLEVFKRVVPNDYYRPIAEGGEPSGTPHPSFAIYRGMAELFSELAFKGTRSAQARFYQSSAVQKDIPATSSRVASAQVTLSRVGPTDQALVIDPGRMRLEADGGREYVNLSQIVWNPGDTEDRVATFVCEVAGFIGNLDHLANDDGSLDLDLISIKDQDRDRAAPGGSVIGGIQVAVQDSGIPDLFAPEDVGLYLRINTSSSPVLVGQVRRITGFEWPELELPAGSGRYPRRVFLDPLVRKNTVEALLDDGGVFTDFYAQASNETPDDVPLLPAAPAINDAFYFGFTSIFAGVPLQVTTPGEGDWTVVWEYWNGVAWAALPDIDDATEGFKPPGQLAGEYVIRWTVPLDWQPLASPSGSGLDLFLVRARVSAFVSITTQPLAGRATVLVGDGLDGFSNTVESLADDGGVVTDLTVPASNNALNDVPLMPAPPAPGDRFYVGSESPFDTIRFEITTPAAGNNWQVIWEYWDGGAWVIIPGVNDNTDSFRNGGSRTVTFNPPADWQISLSPGVSGKFLYFVRSSLVVLVAAPTQPLASRISLGAVLDDGTLGWTLLDFEEDALGLRIVACEAFTGGRDNDLWVLGDERGVYRQNGESDEVFADRASRLADVVSPNAILRTINRTLAPLGYVGRAQDVQFGGIGGGFTGLFLDVAPLFAPDIVGACDLYAAGDLFPKNPWLVLQSAQEAYGWFIVTLPYLGDGDFGIFCDEGPLYFDDTVQVYYGPALGGWCDGFPIGGNATYSAIYAAIDSIRAGGVGFTLVRSENLTTP